MPWLNHEKEIKRIAKDVALHVCDKRSTKSYTERQQREKVNE